MSFRDRDLEAPWVGKTPEEYYGYDEDADCDEDFEYELRRDMEIEE